MAAATGFVYLIAYDFEAGYIGYFGLPAWLVEMSLGRALAGGLLTVYGLYFIQGALNTVYFDATALNTLLVDVFFPAVGALVGAVLGVQAVLRPLGIVTRLICLVIALILFVAFFKITVEPVLRFRGEAKWADRYQRANERRAATTFFDVFIRRGKAAGINVPLLSLALALAFVAVISANTIGSYAAEREAVHLISSSPVRLAAVRQYGDRILCVEVDSIGRLLPRFRFVSASDSNRSWTLVRTGRMAPPSPVQRDSVR